MKRIAVIDKELLPKDKTALKNFSQQIAGVCPVNRSGQECVSVDKQFFPKIDEDLCIGCGLCVKSTEKSGYRAIDIINLPQQLAETPIHRFGTNEFVLFRLPYPTEGVTGIVGPNGCGKTTALKILSGELKPNLGEPGKEVSFSELTKIFRGTELQAYFEKVENKEIKTSIKTQRVDQIPSTYRGKVSKLLEKTDEREILNDLLKIFNIESILSSKIKEISGGELQRVAIAATLAKEADIYYFDEPTSFLDVFQRLTVAKTIKQFSENKSILVVDHDLATLDFLADKVHIFYGHPGAYGIVSKPHGVRAGINTFLDGYLKEDNVRFRSYPISFFLGFSDKGTSQKIIASFGRLKKKFPKFELEVKSGDVRQGEVLAMLGANALGKTTLAKILAGEMKPDEGEISEEIKISYKPQYIKTDFRGTVNELFSSIKSKSLENFRTEILLPLQLEKLLEKNVAHLSGGELQRVAITLTLIKEADLYLLDEPSAFLDVEQRLAVARLVNGLVEANEKSAIVIDHDLLFLSQIGSRGVVFTGEPSVRGYAQETVGLKESFNSFLEKVGITFRKDPQTGRPRANKLDSQIDQEQKETGNYFYI